MYTGVRGSLAKTREELAMKACRRRPLRCKKKKKKKTAVSEPSARAGEPRLSISPLNHTDGRKTRGWLCKLGERFVKAAAAFDSEEDDSTEEVGPPSTLKKMIRRRRSIRVSQ